MVLQQCGIKVPMEETEPGWRRPSRSRLSLGPSASQLIRAVGGEALHNYSVRLDTVRRTQCTTVCLSILPPHPPLAVLAVPLLIRHGTRCKKISLVWFLLLSVTRRGRGCAKSAWLDRPCSCDGSNDDTLTEEKKKINKKTRKVWCELSRKLLRSASFSPISSHLPWFSLLFPSLWVLLIEQDYPEYRWKGFHFPVSLVCVCVCVHVSGKGYCDTLS